jgi:hypothetical protein
MLQMDEDQPKKPSDLNDVGLGIDESRLSPYSHAFVVKIWLEELETEDHRALWSGWITHVNTRERRYFRALSEILDFITPRLAAWNAEADQS